MLRMLYFIIGFAGLGGQVLLLRRALVTFTGNELTVSVMLAAWTAWTGLGSWLGGRLSGKWSAETILNILFVLLLLLLPTTYCAVYLAKPIMGVGLSEAVGPFKMAAMSFVIVAPACLVLGALFPVLCHRLSSQAVAHHQCVVGAIHELPLQNAGIAVGRTYLWEAIGAGAGGLISSALLITFLRPLAAVFALCATGAACMAAASKGKWRVAWIAVSLVAIAGVSEPFGDGWLQSKRWAGYPLTAETDSRYANLALIITSGESTLFVDGLPAITWPGAAPAEESAHLPMLAHPKPRRVLLIGGGLATIGSEILKYPIERLDYCEFDPAIIEMERRVSADIFTDPRVRVHPIDGRRFINEAPAGAYDVVIIAAGDPQTLAANRYFSREMFHQARRALAKPGVIGFATGEHANYIDPLQSSYLALIRRTLQAEFDEVSVYPLGRFYFLGGLGVGLPESPDEIARVLAQRGISTRFFRPEVFIPNLSPERFNSARQAIDAVSEPEINEDFHPLGYALWTAYRSTLFSDTERNALRHVFRIGPGTAFIALAVLLVIGVFIVRRGAPMCAPDTGSAPMCAPANTNHGEYGQTHGSAPTVIVVAMGFSEMVISVSVLYAGEVRLGMLFSLMGYLITALMVGLSLGAYGMGRLPEKRLEAAFIWLSALLLVILLAMIPLFTWVLTRVGETSSIILLTSVALSGSAVSGAIYAGAARIAQDREGRADRLGGRINMADLLGSAAGALIAGTLMLPVWGFSTALSVTAAVMAAGMAIWFAGLRQRVLR